MQGSLLNKSLPIKGGLVGSSGLFGTPSYPSPLDRIRGGKQRLDLNATFPKLQKGRMRKVEFEFDMCKPKLKLGQISSKAYKLPDVLHSQFVLEIVYFNERCFDD